MAAKKKTTTTKAARKETTPRKPGAKRNPNSKVAQESARLDRLTVDLICETAKDVHKEILKQKNNFSLKYQSGMRKVFKLRDLPNILSRNLKKTVEF